MRAWLGTLLHNKENITDDIVKRRVRVASVPGSNEAHASYWNHMQSLKDDANLHQWYDISHRLPLMTVPMGLIWPRTTSRAQLI